MTSKGRTKDQRREGTNRKWTARWWTEQNQILNYIKGEWTRPSKSEGSQPCMLLQRHAWEAWTRRQAFSLCTCVSVPPLPPRSLPAHPSQQTRPGTRWLGEKVLSKAGIGEQGEKAKSELLWKACVGKDEGCFHPHEFVPPWAALRTLIYKWWTWKLKLVIPLRREMGCRFLSQTPTAWAWQVDCSMFCQAC